MQDSCPSYVTSQSYAQPQPIRWASVLQGRVSVGEGLAAVQALLGNSQNMGGLSTLFRIQSTALYGLLGIKLTPSQPEPVQQLNVDLQLQRVEKVFCFVRVLKERKKKNNPKPPVLRIKQQQANNSHS